ncbi:MAG TPA: hypothetical protein VNW28_06140, partial [Chthoniobacterales bacterium]|nr:hypothetical protein [Chthoniobacterales bacterium]
MLALVFQALLHELDIFGDRLVEFINRVAAEDATLAVVGGGSKRRDCDVIEVILEILLRYPAVRVFGSEGRLSCQKLMVKMLVRLENPLVSEQ